MKITWDQFQSHTEKLLNKIREDNFNPDIIVAIGNSGFIPAVLLAKGLKIKELQSITIKSYDKNNKKSQPEIISTDLPSSLEGKKVLCVDDIVATGETFKLVKQVIEKLNPEEIRFAVPVVSEYVCKDYPDFWGESILRDHDDFLSFPWDSFADF